MNDRFKFRVWDKGNEQYLNFSEVDYLTLDTENGGLIIGFLDELMTELTYMPEKDMVVEQCTGLKDKNGNLIYESDYVKANDIIYRVFWDKTKISLVNILNGDMIDISETITMEIVGNEHEKDNISEIPKNPKRSSD